MVNGEIDLSANSPMNLRCRLVLAIIRGSINRESGNSQDSWRGPALAEMIPEVHDPLHANDRCRGHDPAGGETM